MTDAAHALIGALGRSLVAAILVPCTVWAFFVLLGIIAPSWPARPGSKGP